MSKPNKQERLRQQLKQRRDAERREYDRGDSEHLVREARSLYARGDAPAAHRLGRRALALTPDYVPALDLLGQIHFDAAQYADAAYYFGLMRKRDDDPGVIPCISARGFTACARSAGPPARRAASRSAGPARPAAGVAGALRADRGREKLEAPADLSQALLAEHHDPKPERQVVALDLREIGAEFLLIPLPQRVRIQRHDPAEMLDVFPIAPQISFQLRQCEIVCLGARNSQRV